MRRDVHCFLYDRLQVPAGCIFTPDPGTILFFLHNYVNFNIVSKINSDINSTIKNPVKLLNNNVLRAVKTENKKVSLDIKNANNIKEEYMGVNRETLEDKGAVSSEVAKEMVCGLLKKEKTDIAISITGIAGPTGEVAGKPIGLVYIGIGNKDIIDVKRFEVDQDKYFGIKRDKREKNRYNNFELLLARKLTKFIFSQVALELLYDFLLKRYNNNR